MVSISSVADDNYKLLKTYTILLNKQYAPENYSFQGLEIFITSISCI